MVGQQRVDEREDPRGVEVGVGVVGGRAGRGGRVVDHGHGWAPRGGGRPSAASPRRYLTARSSLLPGARARPLPRPATAVATSTLGACRPAPGRSWTTPARSPSPTAAAPATGPRTPCRRSRARWPSATATSRPTCTSPPTGCSAPSTTSASTASPTAPALIRELPWSEVPQARVDGREPIPLPRGPARHLARPAGQHRPQARFGASTPWPTSSGAPASDRPGLHRRPSPTAASPAARPARDRGCAPRSGPRGAGPPRGRRPTGFRPAAIAAAVRAGAAGRRRDGRPRRRPIRHRRPRAGPAGARVDHRRARPR